MARIHRPGQIIIETPTHVLVQELLPEIWQQDKLDNMFEAARHLYNTLVEHYLNQYKLYQESRQYKISIAILNDNKSTKKQKCIARKTLAKTQLEYGFSLSSFEAESSKLCQGCLKGKLYCMVRQKLAADCWNAFSKLLSGEGQQVNFKSFFNKEATLQNKHNKGPFRYNYDKGCFICNGMEIPIKFAKNDPYVQECMTHRVKYCALSRRVIRSKVRYYICLYLEGIPPVKQNADGTPKHPIALGANVGIDIGPQTVTCSSQNGVMGDVLASELGDVQAMQNKMASIKRAMDRSRRATNPQFFDKEGKIVPIDKVPAKHKTAHSRRIWIKSKHYLKLEAQLRNLYRKQAAIRKQSHYLEAYRILALGTVIHVEKMSFAGLAKRAKETKRSQKTGRFRSKKRFGRSIANRAPAMLIAILKWKLNCIGGILYQSNTYKIKASQFNHETGEYVKKSLGERYHVLSDGTKIQRDYYAAFILEHVIEDKEIVDIEACKRDFPAFYAMYQADYARLATYKGYLPSSLGIKRA